MCPICLWQNYTEHHVNTPLDMVGLQVWRGAFLLADFLLHSATNEAKNFKIFHDDMVIELGAGTGLTSIVAGMVAGHVVSTGKSIKKSLSWFECDSVIYIILFSDILKGNILSLIETNIEQNSKWIRGQVEAVELDFYKSDYSEKLLSLIEDSNLIIAADGIK